MIYQLNNFVLVGCCPFFLPIGLLFNHRRDRKTAGINWVGNKHSQPITYDLKTIEALPF